MYRFYEFFAGGGMARAGLGAQWECLFANDFDFKKGKVYQENWGVKALKVADIRTLSVEDLPGIADLVWASFPCQDLSLAGLGAGLKGNRSGTFWPFWKLVESLGQNDRAPHLIVLENVCGTLTSHDGADFQAICTALAAENYKFGALVVDASYFLPHSRPRLFIIGVRRDMQLHSDVIACKYSDFWHTRNLRNAYDKLTQELKNDWIWWHLPDPPTRTVSLLDIIDDNSDNVMWHSREQTDLLLNMMNQLNVNKVQYFIQRNLRTVGTIYKRTRIDNGVKVQRAEVRFDETAGCLRTPAGGSSRQLIIVVKDGQVRTRLITARETARLMGLPDTYILPSNYNEAYHLTGDGLVVPVVNYISNNILTKVMGKIVKDIRSAA